MNHITESSFGLILDTTEIERLKMYISSRIFVIAASWPFRLR